MYLFAFSRKLFGMMMNLAFKAMWDIDLLFPLKKPCVNQSIDVF